MPPPNSLQSISAAATPTTSSSFTADRAFGSFMSTLEKSGRLSNTTVIVTGDHGESFEGGIYQHENKNMTRRKFISR